MTITEPWHGSLSGYQYHHCRCQSCRDAKAMYDHDYRARMMKKGPSLPPSDPRHGTANGYNNLCCRCDDCRRAWREAIRARVTAWRRKKGARVRSEIPLAPCGTNAAYQRHLKAKEKPCDACRATERDRRRKYRALAQI